MSAFISRMTLGINKIAFALVLLCCKLDVVLGECNEEAPLISDASNNSTGSPPFPEGTVIKYECNAGFRERNDVTGLVCVNGEWAGIFGCAKIKCDMIEPPENGFYERPPKHNIGDSLYFSCRPGFKIVGSKTIRCKLDGRWSPSIPPSCERVSCGEFGHIGNASLLQQPIGNENSYGSTIHVTCDDGFILDGLQKIKCRTSGEWDEKPKCRTSPCGSHPALKSSCIKRVDVTQVDSDRLFFDTSCLPYSFNTSVTEIGRGTAFCTRGKWDELAMGCFCDCKVKADFSTVIAMNLDSNKFLKHESVLQWKCEIGFTKKNEGSFKCLDEEIGLPECILDVHLKPSDDTIDFVDILPAMFGCCVFILELVIIIYLRCAFDQLKRNDDRGNLYNHPR